VEEERMALVVTPLEALVAVVAVAGIGLDQRQ
jgi:hypothetical protein